MRPRGLARPAALAIALPALLLLAAPSPLACARRSCPDYGDIVDRESMQGFDIERYQGIWYTAAAHEPTEPWACHCDQYNWTLTSATTYSNELTASCGRYPLDLSVVGRTSEDPANPGDTLEGMPPAFPLIPLQILYVEPNGTSADYTACIRYACKEDYWVAAPPFYYPRFESVQIFTREQVATQSTLDRLVRKAVDIGIVTDVSKLRNLTYAGCSPPSQIPGLDGVAST